MANLILKNVKKNFGKIRTIHGINIEIKDKEFVVFIGPSGCGKSTLLRLIAGLEVISEGDLFIDDLKVNDYPPSQRDIAMVFQSYALYPHMNVYNNMAFGLKLAKNDTATIDEKVKKAACILQLENCLDRLPKHLSGGQRQRVAIGRAIVRRPKVFLLDEPLSNLDTDLRVNTRLEIAKIHKEIQTTTIYVTHDQVEAMTLADKIVVLRDGYLEQVGKPLELYHHPINRFVAGFLGSPKMNFLDAVVNRLNETTIQVKFSNNDTIQLSYPQGMATQRATCLGIRPEHASLCAVEEGHLKGKVFLVERLGESEFAYIELPCKQRLIVRVPGGTGTQEGSRKGIKLDITKTHLFDEKGVAVGRKLDEKSLI